MPAPRNTGIIHTVITAMTREDMLLGPIVEGGFTGRTFEAWGADGLMLDLRPGDVVAVNTPHAHQSPRVRAPTKARDTDPRDTRTYFLDLKPREEALSKLTG